MYKINPQQILGSAYTSIVLVGIAVIARFYLRGFFLDHDHAGDKLQTKTPPIIGLEDIFILFAFVAFNVLAAITIAVVPRAYSIIDVINNYKPAYNGLYDDEVYQLRVLFASGILFPTLIWAVKLFLMFLSRKLLAGRPKWIRFWWIVLVVVILTYFINIILTLSSRVPIQGYFVPGGCDTEKDTDTQIATLYFLLVTEILTDGLIMALPVAYLRQAQLGRKKYLQTAGIFSVGLICIVVAICRGGTIGSRMRVNMPTFPWVAIWQMIEGGITVIVGCIPIYAASCIQSRRLRQARTASEARSSYTTREVGKHKDLRTFITTKSPSTKRSFGLRAPSLKAMKAMTSKKSTNDDEGIEIQVFHDVTLEENNNQRIYPPD